MHIPTAFSPDGDGVNDVFFVRGYGLKLDAFTLAIYDRWGEQIYLSHDMNQGWDGRYKDKLVKSDVYVYHVYFRDAITGTNHEESGTVTVIR
jgi:gliding motility-associated-like protein